MNKPDVKRLRAMIRDGKLSLDQLAEAFSQHIDPDLLEQLDGG